jgi:heme/copper-type cytochrome/quinol oxidase subunit 2
MLYSLYTNCLDMLVIFCLEQVSIITTMLETSVVLDSIDQINTTGNVLETAVSNNEVSSFSIEKEETMVSYSIKTDADASLKHDSWDLPWPASENMNSLVILYLEVSYTVLFIFLVVSVLLFETILVHTTSKPVNYLNLPTVKSSTEKNKEIVEPFIPFPVHFTTEEEHFIDMFVILIPTVIVLQIIVPTLGYLYNEEMLYYDTYISFDINIIGNQWFWTYEYIIDICSNNSFNEWNSDYVTQEKEQLIITFDSVIKLENTEYRLLDVDNPLIVPVHTNILLSFTSRDVIHSWALPQMGIKVDCVPGRITHTIFSSFCMGVFYGQCSELCGPLHGFMPICVEVIPFDKFFIWILVQYKTVLSDLGLNTSLVYTKEVFTVLNLKTSKETESFFTNLTK